MFSGDYLNFSFPLFTTSVHMIVQFSLSCLVLYLFPRFRPRHDALSNPHDSHVLRDGRAAANLDRPLMTKRFYLTRIGPCGAATGLDIGLGNMSLKFITLTFYSGSHTHTQPVCSWSQWLTDMCAPDSHV